MMRHDGKEKTMWGRWWEDGTGNFETQFHLYIPFAECFRVIVIEWLANMTCVVHSFSQSKLFCVFFTRIDLIMDVEAILMSRQICLEMKCLHGNPMSNNFHKTLLLKFHELETIDTRKRILSTKYERCSWARKNLVVYFPYISLYFSHGLFLTVHGSINRGKNLSVDKGIESSKRDRMISSTAVNSSIFSVKSFA